MKTDVEQLISDVYALLGESIARDCIPEESPYPDLGLRVRLLAPGILADLIKETPVHLLSGFKKISGVKRIDDNGRVILPIPDDFLKLISLKMSDWTYSVNVITAPSASKAIFQHCSWKGIRGSPSRPVVTSGVDTDGTPSLFLYSSSKDATLESADYLPIPAITPEGFLEVPEALYSPLLRQLQASLI